MASTKIAQRRLPFTQLWVRQRSRIELHARQTLALRHKMMDDALAVVGRAVGGVERFDTDAACAEARAAIVDALASKASAELGHWGLALAIDENMLHRALGMSAGRWPEGGPIDYSLGAQERNAMLNDAFDPDAVWAWLVQNYSSQDETIRQMVRGLRALFYIDLRAPTERRARLCLTVTTSCVQHVNGRRAYDGSSAAKIASARATLAAVAHWGQDTDTAHALRLQATPTLMAGDSVGVERGGRIALGRVEIETYYDRADFLLAQPLADRFRLFVHKHVGSQGPAA